MFSKATIAVAAALALGSAFIATDAFAANRGHSNGGMRSAGVHTGGQRGPGGHRHVGYRGGYGSGYSYNSGYDGPGYGYEGDACLPVPVPIVGCW
jgi:hypothetical protein